MKSVHIHIRIPTARQLAADAAELAVGAAEQACRLLEKTAKRPVEEAPADIPAAAEALPAEVETVEDAADAEPSLADIPEDNKFFSRAWNAATGTVRSAVAFAADVKTDIDAICDRDPAARSRAEVLCLYSGLHALMLYRAAHALHMREHYFPARLISQGAKFLTGIEIHPGATIGQGLFIDHGSGVVIGETAIVGDNCTLYQGVTLGGTGKDTGKRHPTLGDNVLVGAGAKLLGNFTIGDGAKIAAGAVVLRDVPENCTAVGIPARVVRRGGEKLPAEEMDQTHIPDPVAQQFARIEERLLKLEAPTSVETDIPTAAVPNTDEQAPRSAEEENPT